MQYFEILDTPLGIITLLGSSSHLEELHFGKLRGCKNKASSNGPVNKAKLQLLEYFSGKRTHFDIPLSVEGTEFQECTWKNLEKIPFGKLFSYGELAQAMNNPHASRAVGGANNKNPIPIIIPCHRVVGVSGDLVGFAPGLKAKTWLLRHEGHKIVKNNIISVA